MSQDWQINPEDTRSVYIMTNSGNKISKTIAQIKALINAHGFNSCILAKALYYASGDAYMILTNYGNVSNTLYLGGSTYLSLSNSNSIGFSFPAKTNYEQTTRWLLNDSGTDIFNRTGSTMNYLASAKVVNNVTYYYINNDYSDATYPPIYVTTYSGEIYYDGEPPITYHWQSVLSISGKNGISQLSQIASASINNGEAVSGASASDFDSLTAQVSTLVTDDSQIAGADAGGISGSGSNSGNQSSGYAFGQGESGTDLSGGGSGYYGGEKGGSLLSGGAGSGYIGNSLLSNKKMVGYNVPTSSAEGTKTESVNEVSASAVSGKPKIGNGFVRIKMVEQLDPMLLDMINGDGFFWKDWSSSIVYGDYDSTMNWNADGNYSAHTWVTDNAAPVTTSDYKTTTGGVAFVAVGSKATLFISKDANGYTGTIACGERIANQWRGSASIRFQSAKFAYKNGSTQWSDWPGQTAEIPSTLSYTSETLNGVLEYFAKRLRNIYIA